ncbi:GTP-binding protein [Streptomyces sp. CA-253872]|uniref:GTP-binding protein n=1 Tax=Streptomyces sp. CA-253872 TaxID=3240067 RepID=UPI003D8C9ABE
MHSHNLRTAPSRALLNLGVLAHVDAGKTSLTERLLHAAGLLDEPGSVDAGTTRTDSLDLERRRGITIKAAVVSFPLGDRTVHLVDTPGHPDFIAEVERVLAVLDGAVLVVSAVEGVQPQTRVLLRTLRRLGIPTLLFVNKIDRRGARELLGELRARLGPGVVPLGVPHGAGTPGARFVPYAPDEPAYTEALCEVLTAHDDALLGAYIDGGLSPARLGRELRGAVAAARVHPVLYGSALTGAGIEELRTALATLLPAARGDAGAPLSASVFKIERGRGGERRAYARLHAGTLSVRERVPYGDGRSAVLTGLDVFADGGPAPAREARAGQIAVVRGLPGIRIGDRVGTGAAPGAVPAASGATAFAPPSLSSVVVPEGRSDALALWPALSELAEQDPLIGLRRDPAREEISVSLYGEVQKEVIATTLLEEYGVRAGFRASRPLCVERVRGEGSAVEVGERDGNPFLATIGLRVSPGAPGSGTVFRLGIEPGSLPPAFLKAIEETVHAVLGEGLRGWPVVDGEVTLLRSGYWPRQSHSHAVFDKSMSSTAGDFRLLTPLVLMSALRAAGTVVEEPVHRFRLEVPGEVYGAVLPLLGRLGAVPGAPRAAGGTYTVEGEVPAAHVHELGRLLPGPSRGEGVLETEFATYRPVRGQVPRRARTDADPLHREAYLLRVVRGVPVDGRR